MAFGRKKLPGPPREYTAEEVREMFIKHIIAMIGYWNGEGNSNVNPNESSRYKMEGLVHSILVTIDGGCGGIPAFDLVCKPHPDDKEYLKSQEEDWYPENVVINDCQLHDLYNAIIRK